MSVNGISPQATEQVTHVCIVSEPYGMLEKRISGWWLSLLNEPWFTCALACICAAANAQSETKATVIPPILHIINYCTDRPTTSVNGVKFGGTANLRWTHSFSH